MAGDVLVAHCPVCAEPVDARYRFCEGCGADLRADTTSAAGSVAGVGPDACPADPHARGSDPGTVMDGSGAHPATRWASTGVTGTGCPSCGGTVGIDGYCADCGARRPAGAPHASLALAAIAAVTDIGHRHAHNEDAVGIGLTGALTVAVVCDGVSASDRPDLASHAAVRAALPAMLDRLAVDDEDYAGALFAATVAGQTGAAAVAGPVVGANPPSTTFVAAVVAAGTVTIGWVGDSRAYWLPDVPAVDLPHSPGAQIPGTHSPGAQTPGAQTPGTHFSGAQTPVVWASDMRVSPMGAPSDVLGGEPACLTVDDALPGGLLRWLGVDAPDTRPHLARFTVTRPGRLVVCSDGLSRYLSAPADLATVALATVAFATVAPPGGSLSTADALVRFALDAGGVDNVTVAVLPVAPADHRAPVAVAQPELINRDGANGVEGIEA